MNKKNLRRKREKGITLVALIITIIVLLILAVVAIRQITGDGIIEHAKNAKTKYLDAQKEEEDRLMQYEYELAKSNGSTQAKSYDEYVLEQKYVFKGIAVKIGDIIQYDCYTGVDSNKLTFQTNSDMVGDAYIVNPVYRVSSSDAGLNWVVIGIEDGKILIKSTTKFTDKLCFYSNTAYLNGPQVLDALCSIYGHGVGADSARSLTTEDLDKLKMHTPRMQNIRYVGEFLNSDGTTTIGTEENPITLSIRADDNFNYGFSTNEMENCWLATRSVAVQEDSSLVYGLDVYKDQYIKSGITGADATSIGKFSYMPVIRLKSNIQLEWLPGIPGKNAVWKIVK